MYEEFNYNHKDEREKKFWMVTGSGNQPKIRHNLKSAAEAEAVRLAQSNPGKSFYVLEAIGEYTQEPSVTIRPL